MTEGVFAAVAAERRGIADLLDGLDDAQLATPSLCAGWDVRTVGAHLVSVVADGFWTFQRATVRHGGIGRGIDHLARRRAREPVPAITAALRERADQQLSPPVTGPRSGLADVLVHGGDIRVPLGLEFAPDPWHCATALDFLTGRAPLGFVPPGRLRGLRLVSTDLGRWWGAGEEVRAPTAVLMMVAGGRRALLDRAEGSGLSVLARRLGA